MSRFNVRAGGGYSVIHVAQALRRRVASVFDLAFYLSLAVAVGVASVFGLALPVAAQQGSTAIIVEKFAMGPSEILSEDELAAVTDRYIGRPMPVDDLNIMVAEINALYETRGFVARAVLPPQTIIDGVVEVQLVEGRVNTVIVDGHKHTRESFITHRLGLYPGDLVDLNVMAESLQAFNATYDVELRAELRPGEQFGTTDYLVYVGEPKNDRFTLWTDNGGRSETGADRTNLTWTRRSLLGYRDPLSVTLFGGPGSKSASLSYSLPLGRTGTRLGVNYSYSQIDVIDGEFEDVGIQGATSQAGLDVRVPYVLAEHFPASWSLAYNATDSGTYFEGHKLTGRQVAVWQAAANVQVPGPGAQWDFGYVLRTGPQSGTTEAFVTHKLSATRQRQVWRGLLLVSATGQMTDSKLLPDGEKSVLGGSDSNRGYPVGWRSGDQGYSVNAEYTMPLSSRIQGSIHIDHGGVMPYKGNEEPITSWDYLTSAALTFNVQLTEIVGMRLMWGVPLDAHGGSNTFYFRLQATF